MAQDEWVVVRLRMQDSARFIAEAKAAGASVQMLERNVASAGAAFRTSTHHGFWFNQLMFTMRRQVYGLTLGLGLLAAGAGVLGFKFEIGMDAAKMAFERFLGSPQAAQKEIEYLFDLAALTPFEFPQLADATRKFLSFGYSVDESNKTLEALADGIAAFGFGADEINRGVIALGQMRTAGRVLGQDLRQLTELGLFNPEDFLRRLRLPPGSMGNIGQLNIPSKAGIDAITAYWREKFGGASEDFAKTFMGRITTLRDYAGRAFGQMVRPLKDRLTDEIFPLLIDIAKTAGEGFESGGMAGFFEAIDEGLNRGTNLAGVWRYLADVTTMLYGSVRILASAFWNAWQTIRGNVIVFGSLYILVWTLYQVLNLLEPVLEYLVALWLAERFALLVVTAATKGKILWDIIETAWMRRKTWAIKTLYAWRLRDVYLYLWQTRVQRAAAFANLFFTATLWPLIAATWAWTAALLANPITWIILAIIGLGAALYIAYTRSEAFRRAVNDLLTDARTFKAWWDDNLGWLTSGPSGKEVAQGTWSWLKAPHFQFGGTMPFPGGPAFVGEGGPELVYLPGGARVVPMEHMAIPGMSMGDGVITLINKVILDGREIGESVTRHRLDKKARV